MPQDPFIAALVKEANNYGNYILKMKDALSNLKGRPAYIPQASILSHYIERLDALHSPLSALDNPNVSGMGEVWNVIKNALGLSESTSLTAEEAKGRLTAALQETLADAKRNGTSDIIDAAKKLPPLTTDAKESSLLLSTLGRWIKKPLKWQQAQYNKIEDPRLRSGLAFGALIIGPGIAGAGIRSIAGGLRKTTQRPVQIPDEDGTSHVIFKTVEKTFLGQCVEVGVGLGLTGLGALMTLGGAANFGL